MFWKCPLLTWVRGNKESLFLHYILVFACRHFARHSEQNATFHLQISCETKTGMKSLRLHGWLRYGMSSFWTGLFKKELKLNRIKWGCVFFPSHFYISIYQMLITTWSCSLIPWKQNQHTWIQTPVYMNKTWEQVLKDNWKTAFLSEFLSSSVVYND